MKDVMKIGFTITLSVLTIVFQGCDSKSPGSSVTAFSHSSSPIVSNPTITTNPEMYLKEIIGNEAAPDLKQTPEDSVLNQLQWRLSNDKLISASKESIAWSTTFGKNSLVVLKVPETTMHWYNFILLSNKDQKWDFYGVIDMPITKTLYTDKQGLALPMESFASAKLTSEDSKPKTVWAFGNDSMYAVIGTYPREGFTLPVGSEELSIAERQSWMIIEKEHSLLFYFDTDYLVWISGKLTRDEIINLTTSLPSIESSKFPFQNMNS